MNNRAGEIAGTFWEALRKSDQTDWRDSGIGSAVIRAFYLIALLAVSALTALVGFYVLQTLTLWTQF